MDRGRVRDYQERIERRPDRSRIGFSGDWLPWRPEFYNGVLYWEAWLLSSGSLTVENGRSYTVDAWGIGGGAFGNWVQGGPNNPIICSAGIPNMRTGIEISGEVAVTIGAGGTINHYAGFDTSFGDLLICNGGIAYNKTSQTTDSYKRYRFEDDEKTSETGKSYECISPLKEDPYFAQGGWLPINRAITLGVQGDGFGGGGGCEGYAAPGVLVVRIPA